jgi:hypothetical protein
MFSQLFIWAFLLTTPLFPHHESQICSRRLEKYFRHGRELNWPEGAVSRESIRAVRRLPRLRVRPSLSFFTYAVQFHLHCWICSSLVRCLSMYGRLQLTVRLCFVTESDHAPRGPLGGSPYWSASRLAEVWTIRKVHSKGGIEAPLFQRVQPASVRLLSPVRWLSTVHWGIMITIIHTHLSSALLKKLLEEWSYQYTGKLQSTYSANKKTAFFSSPKWVGVQWKWWHQSEKGAKQKGLFFPLVSQKGLRAPGVSVLVL